MIPNTNTAKFNLIVLNIGENFSINIEIKLFLHHQIFVITLLHNNYVPTVKNEKEKYGLETTKSSF